MLCESFICLFVVEGPVQFVTLGGKRCKLYTSVDSYPESVRLFD